MKLAAATYSFLWDETAESVIDLMHKNGFKGIELCISQPMFDLDQYRPGMYRDLKKRMDGYGMKIINILIPSMDVNIASTTPEMRKMTVDLFKRLADVSMEFEAEMMMTFPGRCSPLLPPKFEVIYEHCLEGHRQILDYTRYTDLTVAIETIPGKFLGAVDDLKKMVQDINNPRFGMVYDAANLGSEDPAKKLRDVKDCVKLLHLSDTKRGEWKHDALGKGDIDYKAYVEAAVEIGYDGYLVLEVINDRGIIGFTESVQRLEETGIKFGR